MLFTLYGYQFNIFEIPLLIYLISYFIIKLLFVHDKVIADKVIAEDKKYLNLFFMSYILLFISKIITFWPAIDKILVISDLLKWAEIFVFIILVFNFKYFKYLYLILFLISFFPVLISIYSSILNFNFFSGYRALPGYPSIFSLSLLIPFSKKNNFIYVICILLIITNILSITRGAWLALIVVLSYYILINLRDSKKYILKMVGIILIVILVVVNIPAVQSNIHRKTLNPFLLNSGSNFERSGMAFLCLSIFSKNPIIGIGSGNFGKYAIKNPYLYKGKILKIPENMAPHVFFLQILAENGIIGLISIVMIFLIFYKILFNKKIYLRCNDYKSYILGLRMLFLSLTIHLIFGYVAGSGRLLLGLFMGLSLSILKKENIIYNIEK